MTLPEVTDVPWPFRFPWQTREDIVIRLLDQALHQAAATREAAAEATDKVRREVDAAVKRRDDGRR